MHTKVTKKGLCLVVIDTAFRHPSLQRASYQSRIISIVYLVNSVSSEAIVVEGRVARTCVEYPRDSASGPLYV